jgi:hypothetical protein
MPEVDFRVALLGDVQLSAFTPLANVSLLMSPLQTKCDRSYPLVHPELVETAILPYAGGQIDAGLPAELREISPASAKLLVAGPPELPSRCRVRMISSKLMRTLEIPAEIGWARPNPAGDWLVECEFLSRLGENQFAELASSGLLERRSAVRFQTRIAVGVEWILGDTRFTGIVRDLSEGGLCLMTSHPPLQSRSVHVIVPTPQGDAILQLKVRWSLCVGQNHLIGCQFIRGEDFHLLRRLQPTSQQQFNEHSRAGRPLNERM